jgi:hypothetical protein
MTTPDRKTPTDLKNNFRHMDFMWAQVGTHSQKEHILSGVVTLNVYIGFKCRGYSIEYQ